MLLEDVMICVKTFDFFILFILHTYISNQNMAKLVIIHCYKDNSDNINVWLETLRVGVKNKLCSNLIYSIGPWISTPYIGVKAAKGIVILSQHMELQN